MKLIISCGMIFLILSVIPSSASAIYYDFNVDSEIANCYVNTDGSADIEYTISFTNYGTIDYVDIGMPNSRYNLGSAKAEMLIDGQVVNSNLAVERSQVLSVGYQIKIPSAYQKSSFTIHTTCSEPVMVFGDTEDKNYASVEFYPTWWGGGCHDISELRTSIYLPVNTNATTPIKWHHMQPSWQGEITDAQGRTRCALTWNSSGNYEHQYGASFSKNYVTRVYDYFWDVRLYEIFPCILSIIIFVAVAVAVLIVVIRKNKKRKMQYLSPKVGIEGAGIRRGFTAPEAAILLGVPLNKILTMILFGLCKKNRVSILTTEPLRLQVKDRNMSIVITDPRDNMIKYRYETYSYEQGFINAITPDGTLDENLLKDMFIDLINGVKNKMKGFCRKETEAYYQSIVNKAWSQVQEADIPELKSQFLDKYIDWLIIDEKYDDKGMGAFRDSYLILPVWWYHYSPTTRARMPAPTLKMPKLPGAEFANRFVSEIQHTSNNIVKNIAQFTSGITAKTNPLPVSTYAGGGYSGSCACACAGCACACAGGGR